MGNAPPDAATSASAAAVRMEPPPRALIILGDGLLVGRGGVGDGPASGGGVVASLAAARPLPHLDGLARAGGAGLLVACSGQEAAAGAALPLPTARMRSGAVLAQLLGGGAGEVRRWRRRGRWPPRPS